MRRYFVTGTDTGVGKTFVTAALARRARAAGHRVFAFKPIETGCPPGAEGEDQRELCAAAGDWQRGRLRGTYTFRLPAAPRVAAEHERRAIDFGAIDEAIDAGSVGCGVVLIEGAGGWRVPITDSVDMGGLARRLGAPVLIVARAGLGTINHTLLTIEAVQRDGCDLAAVILSMRPDDEEWLATSNRDELRRCWNGAVILLGEPSGLDGLVRFT